MIHRAKRLVCLLVLGTFVGLSAAEWAHAHERMAPSVTDCGLCKIAHQTPLLVDQVSVHAPDFTAQSAVFLRDVHIQSHVVFISHGLSPPLS